MTGTWIHPSGSRFDSEQTADGMYRLTFFLTKKGHLKAGENVCNGAQIKGNIEELEAQGYVRT